MSKQTKINGNESSMDDSKNEFVSQSMSQSMEGAQEFQRMFSMFQKMANQPELFMRMMNANQLASSRASGEDISGNEHRRRQYQIEQHKYRAHQVSPRRISPEQSIIVKKDDVNRKKGANIFANDEINMGESVLSVNEQEQKQKYGHIQHNHNPFDEKPIQSEYAARQQQFIKHPTFDVEIYKFENSNLNGSKYVEAEQRPISGIKGDFKSYLQGLDGIEKVQQFGSVNQQKIIEKQQMREYDEENHELSRKEPNKQFLKRGSRQHLSSAKDRSVCKKKPVQNKAKNEEIEQNNEKSARSISQNRVLGRKTFDAKSTTKNGDRSPKGKKAINVNVNNNNNNNNNTNTKSIKSSVVPNIPAEERAPIKLEQNVHNRRKNTHQDSQSQQLSPTFKSYHYQSVTDHHRNAQVQNKNIFQDSSSDDQSNQIQRQSHSPHSNAQFQAIPGVYLTKKQLHQILSKYSSQQSQWTSDQQTIKQLKNKYIDLCNVLTEEKQLFEEQMAKAREEFEVYKNVEIGKIRNERKVQQRNLMNTKKEKEREKEKEDFEMLKKEVEKEREEYKRKDKNNRIIAEKYKKEVEELKIKMVAMEEMIKNIPNSLALQNTNTGNNLPKQKKGNPPPNKQQNQQNQQNLEYTSGKNQQHQQQHQQQNQQLQEHTSGKNQQHQQHQQNQQHQEHTSGKNQQKKQQPTSNLPSYNQLKPNNRKYQYHQKEDSLSQEQYEKIETFGQIEQDEQREEDEEIVEYNPSMKLSDLTKIPLNIKMVTPLMIENMFRYENNPEYKAYLEVVSKNRTKIHTSKNSAERKVTNIFADGGKQVIFEETGTRKEQFNNGYEITFFPIGDIKQKLTDGTILYYFGQKDVDQITLPNGINIYRFQNDQVEFHLLNGAVEIRHPDGTYKII